jgi:hypothetical protein
MNVKEQLLSALLTKGQQALAEHLDISSAEMSRKIAGEHGFTMDQIANALEFVGASILERGDDRVLLDKEELKSLNLLAKRYLDRRCN